MGILTQYSSDIGGIDDSLIAKIGNTPLTTTAQDLSSAINEHESDIISIISDKVNKSGDTMTGILSHKQSTIDISTTPSSIQYGKGTNLLDKNNNLIGFFDSYQDTQTTIGIATRIYATRKIGSTTYYNGIQLRIANDGTLGVYVDCADKWRSALGLNNRAGSSSDGGSATSAETLVHKTLNSTTLNNTAGSFAFSGSGSPWEGSDWVGLQIGDSYDKFQISAQNNTLLFRQNDNGGTSTNWSDWVALTTSTKTNSSLTITAWQDTSHTGPITPTGLSGDIYYYRRGNVVIVKLSGVKIPAHTSRMDLIPAVPAGFRPPSELESNRGTFFIEPDGSIRMESNNSAQQIWDNICYIAWG